MRKGGTGAEGRPRPTPPRPAPPSPTPPAWLKSPGRSGSTSPPASSAQSLVAAALRGSPPTRRSRASTLRGRQGRHAEGGWGTSDPTGKPPSYTGCTVPLCVPKRLTGPRARLSCGHPQATLLVACLCLQSVSQHGSCSHRPLQPTPLTTRLHAAGCLKVTVRLRLWLPAGVHKQAVQTSSARTRLEQGLIF